MSNNFCKFLSNGYSFNKNNYGITVSPCCWWDGPRLNLSPSIEQERKIQFESITTWTDKCKRCRDLELANQPSLRQSSFDMIEETEMSSAPVAVDVMLDTECNAACVICSDELSSLWRKQISRVDNKTFRVEAKSTILVEQIVNTVSLKKLKYVKFYGGEPLFTDIHLTFLKQIPDPSQVTVHYTTNGSIYPNDEVLQIWKKFKLIIFAVSLDGVDEQFDYVRWPLPWTKVSSNILRLKENKDIWNLMFRVEFTANLLNTYYFDKLETWVKHNLATNHSGDITDLNIHPCFDNSVWNLETMPISTRKLILDKYPATHIIHNLVKNLPAPTTLEPWQNFVNKWDKHRKNSWKTAFPALVDHFDF